MVFAVIQAIQFQVFGSILVWLFNNPKAYAIFGTPEEVDLGKRLFPCQRESRDDGGILLKSNLGLQNSLPDSEKPCTVQDRWRIIMLIGHQSQGSIPDLTGYLLFFGQYWKSVIIQLYVFQSVVSLPFVLLGKTCAQQLVTPPILRLPTFSIQLFIPEIFVKTDRPFLKEIQLPCLFQLPVIRHELTFVQGIERENIFILLTFQKSFLILQVIHTLFEFVGGGQFFQLFQTFQLWRIHSLQIIFVTLRLTKFPPKSDVRTFQEPAILLQQLKFRRI